MTVLATAHSDPANTARIAMTDVDDHYLWQGRVFHTRWDTILTPDSVDFVVTFQRGAEWAATGKVTAKDPSELPHGDSVSYRTTWPRWIRA